MSMRMASFQRLRYACALVTMRTSCYLPPCVTLVWVTIESFEYRQMTGGMQAANLASTLASCQGPLIVIAQAGQVNTGAFDAFREIADIVHDHGGWLHVDGAFGLWARACPL
jgi:hypothetical protein